MFTQICGLRIDHMEHEGARRHDWDTTDCWCEPDVHRFNNKTKEWEEV